MAKCKSNQGLLTCGHVVRELPETGRFGVALFAAKETQDHRYQIDASASVPHSVVIYNPPGNRSGPDIAFLPIPPLVFSSLAAISSVIDLDREKEKMALPTPKNADFVSIVTGLVADDTLPAERIGNRMRLIVSGYGNVGSLKTFTPIEGWDTVEFLPRRESYESGPPRSFGGTSGGGIWKLYLNETSEGQYRVLDSRLAGVAFWEEYLEGPEAQLSIVGHGPHSIYDQLLGKIYAQWPP